MAPWGPETAPGGVKTARGVGDETTLGCQGRLEGEEPDESARDAGAELSVCGLQRPPVAVTPFGHRHGSSACSVN